MIIWSHPKSENQRHQTINNVECGILYNPRVLLRDLPRVEEVISFIWNIVCVDTATPQNERQQSVNSASTEHQHSVNRVSTECQRFWVCISRKYFRPGRMAPSEWTRSVRAVRDTPVADYTAPGVNSTRCIPYRPLIAVSPFLLVLSGSYFERSLWRCGQL
jgi:hypothetical protein